KGAEVAVEDQWDLTSLFKSDGEWEKEFGRWEGMIPGYARFKGKLGESAKVLAECLRFDAEFDRLGEKLGSYAGLKAAGDQGDSVYQRMKGRFQHVAVKAGEEQSFMRPEILALPEARIAEYLKAPELAEWKLALERVVRYRPHTL